MKTGGVQTLAPGTVFGGLRIVRLLGVGGMGVVYEAQQLSLERPAALKVLAAGPSSDELMANGIWTIMPSSVSVVF